MIGEFKDLSILELQPTANTVSDLHRIGGGRNYRCDFREPV